MIVQAASNVSLACGICADARLAAPTPDHYLPLLYVVGARHAEDRPEFPVEGIDGGSVSMLTAKLG